jgi:hypothetical protein
MVRSLGFILSAKRVNGNFSTGEWPDLIYSFEKKKKPSVAATDKIDISICHIMPSKY